MGHRRVIGSELGNNPDQHREILGSRSDPIARRRRLSTLARWIVFAFCLTSHKGHSRHSDCAPITSGLPR
jgi:hypothetical protein